MISISRLAFAAALLPFVAATCGRNEFYFLGRCISLNGHNTPDAGTPPAGVTCPQNDMWYWSRGGKCCNPKTPNHEDTPSCPQGYTYTKNGSACIKTPPAPPTPGRPNNCNNGWFWWDARNTCLPQGGPPSPPQPPSGTKCPPEWSWNSNTRCCTPSKPPVPEKPPVCTGGWDWCDGIKQCQPHPPTPGGPTPSQAPKPPQGPRKRSTLKSRVPNMCGLGLEACQIVGADGPLDEYECVDTKVEAESCGGCSATGHGKDCTKEIPNAFSVGCKNSGCVLYKCNIGFVMSADGTSCVPELAVAARRDF